MTLLLCRHAESQPVDGEDAASWGLTDRGRAEAADFALRLRSWNPVVVVTSVEPKAVETGRIIASVLDVPCAQAAGLHEHDRTGVSWLGREEFEARVRAFFEHPDELVFGHETAVQALSRFRNAVQAVIAEHPDANVCIVSHGTVMTLLAGGGYEMWRGLAMPDLLVLGGVWGV